jgi:GxxExxY protein
MKDSHEDTKARRSEEGSRGDAEARRDLDEMTGAIVDAAVKLHQALGPGLLESVYEAVLARDLERRGLCVERQKVLRFEYDGMTFDEGLRLDLWVEGCVIVELKSVENLNPVHKKQLLTYLRLSGCSVGLLINFGAATLKEGLHRIVNNHSPSALSLLRVNQSAEGGVGVTRRRGDAEKGGTTDA